MVESDIFRGYGVEVLLEEPDDFLKIVETLTRIGVLSRDRARLIQSCHILHKRGRYRILHFKELFCLDGAESSLSEDDIARRNRIVKLLEQWNLLQIQSTELEPIADLSKIKVIPFKDKEKYELVSKYSVGKRKK